MCRYIFIWFSLYNLQFTPIKHNTILFITNNKMKENHQDTDKIFKKIK